jgi:gas vesicle protein
MDMLRFHHDGHHYWRPFVSFCFGALMNSFEMNESSLFQHLKPLFMSTGKIVLGVLAGIAAGTLIGVLVAPDKGTETRRKIRQKGEDLVDNVKDGVSSMVDDAVGRFDKLRGKARRSMNDMLSTTNEESATI